MFTLIRNYRTLFMMGVLNPLLAHEPAAMDVPESGNNAEALKAMIEGKEFEAVEGVTQEQIKDLNAAHEYFSQGGVIEKGAKGAVAKDIQEMLIYVGHQMLSKDGTKNYGADGDFWGASVRATKAFQEVQGLVPTGVVDQNTYIQLLVSVNKKGNVSAEQATAEESMSSEAVDAAVNESVENTTEHALAALDAVKKDRKAVAAIQKAVGSTPDGITWPKTRAAVEGNPQAALTALAQYIDTTDNATVEARLVSEKPADGAAIDAALSELQESMSDEDLIAIAHKFTARELGSAVRNKNAQYISLKLQSLGLENNEVAQRLMEKVMAEGKGHYEAETAELDIRKALVDGSGRFARSLGKFPENFSGSYYRIRQALQWNRTKLENGMETGITGTADSILKELFGVNADFVASRLHVVTGQGTDGDADMSLELAGWIILEHAYYDEKSGAIYATVAEGNGCEGNLVVIPVETFIKPKPKPPVVRRVPKTVVRPVVKPPVVNPPVNPPENPDPDPEGNGDQSSTPGASWGWDGWNGWNGGGQWWWTGGRG